MSRVGLSQLMVRLFLPSPKSNGKHRDVVIAQVFLREAQVVEEKAGITK